MQIIVIIGIDNQFDKILDEYINHKCCTSSAPVQVHYLDYKKAKQKNKLYKRRKKNEEKRMKKKSQSNSADRLLPI